MSLSDNTKVDIIEASNSNSRYLDDLLNIDNPIFEGMVTQIYPKKLQLNKANSLRIPKQHFKICIYRFQLVLFHQNFMTNAMTLILTLVISRYWMVTFLVSLFMVFIYLNSFG